MTTRIAYFINQYPKVSHSFIRREIRAIERQGIAVQRIALRGWDGALADAEDEQERKKTRFVLQGGPLALAWSALSVFVKAPVRFLRALALAIRMSRRAERPLPYHLAYLAEACRMLPWLEVFGARHVHAHFGTNSAEIAMLAHALGGPTYSFTVHGPDELDKPEFLHLGEKMRRARFVVAVSSFTRSQLYRWVERAHWPKIHVVHCGLEPAFHDVAPRPPPEAPRLVCVGRLSYQKGQLLLVEAVHQLAQKGIGCDLVLAGDGEIRGEVQKLIEALGVAKQVSITGWISGSEVRDQILAARGLVLPSFAEGLPVVLMEAMALRRPVLTTYVAGIPELVEPGRTGWLFPAGSIQALTAAMEACLARPVADLEAMGDAARLRALERHAIDTEAEKLSRLLREAAEAATEAS